MKNFNPYIGWALVLGVALLLVGGVTLGIAAHSTQQGAGAAVLVGVILLNLGGTALIGALVIAGTSWRAGTVSAVAPPVPADE